MKYKMKEEKYKGGYLSMKVMKLYSLANQDLMPKKFMKPQCHEICQSKLEKNKTIQFTLEI